MVGPGVVPRHRKFKSLDCQTALSALRALKAFSRALKPRREPTSKGYRDYSRWWEWQDLSLGLLGIDFISVCQAPCAACVLRLCTGAPRSSSFAISRHACAVSELPCPLSRLMAPPHRKAKKIVSLRGSDHQPLYHVHSHIGACWEKNLAVACARPSQ